MKNFTGEDGREWVATAREEDTPRHHGRWFLVLHPANGGSPELMLPEIRWKSRRTAVRTLRTMSDFELRRRLRIATRRHDTPGADRNPFGGWKGGGPGTKGGAEGV
jgi:hypothetical protein